MSICEVSMIAVALLRTANRSRPRGWVRDFSVIDCGAALDIEPDKVGEVYRKLEELGWIDNDYLVTWDERQPDKEDPTAADRQRRRREKLKLERAGKATRDKQFAERDAPRYWLSTDGKAIVMRRLAITDMAAKVTVERWIREAGAGVRSWPNMLPLRTSRACEATRSAMGSGRCSRWRRRKRRQGHPYLLGRW